MNRIYAFLKKNTVSYQSFSHPPAMGAQRLAQREHMSGASHAKAVMGWVDGRLVMLVLDANHHIDMDRLALVLGASEVRPAKESEFWIAFPDCEAGALPPFGNLYGFPVILEAGISHRPVLCFPDGSRDTSIIMSMEDYRRLIKPRVLGFAARELAAAA